MFIFLAACAAGDAVDTAADACADAPVVTWESAGEALITENCQSCHASTSLERQGAPESVTFDTHAQVIERKADILRVTNPETRTMPPSLALSDDDAAQLEIWLSCFE
jgi:uncharacterized membrane protein